MIKNILRNFVSKSATRPYPIDARPGFEHARGELDNRIDQCTLCGICAKKCPSQCIVVSKKERIWEVNPFACVFCGICVEACPKSCLVHSRTHKRPERKKTSLILHKNQAPKLEVV